MDRIMSEHSSWISVGKRGDLVPGAGVGARVGQQQIAIFWLEESPEQLYATANLCPFAGVNIIARGIVGDIGGEPVVASPLHKEHFSLLDGRCFEHPEVSLPIWQARLQGDDLQVREPEIMQLLVS
ncbi:Nitrite reductase [NAD(P)H], small subunit [gamma proteobacterium HdN1]|nr:Nitrite reductase [NAD(P)H], small subunit [gamma proteobacterium HdN1]